MDKSVNWRYMYMNSKKILIVLLLIIIFILFLLLYRNYKNNEEIIIGNGFGLILDRKSVISELENIEDELNINVSNIKSMELSDVFNNEVYWNIELDNNIFIKFDAINRKIKNYKDNNDYTNEITQYIKYDEAEKFIIDKYINLGYNKEYNLQGITKKDNTYLWEAIFVTENDKIEFKFIPEINKIISIDSVQ